MHDVVCMKCKADKAIEKKRQKYPEKMKDKVPEWSGKHWVGCPHFEIKTPADFIMKEEFERFLAPAEVRKPRSQNSIENIITDLGDDDTSPI